MLQTNCTHIQGPYTVFSMNMFRQSAVVLPCFKLTHSCVLTVNTFSCSSLLHFLSFLVISFLFLKVHTVLGCRFIFDICHSQRLLLWLWYLCWNMLHIFYITIVCPINFSTFNIFYLCITMNNQLIVYFSIFFQFFFGHQIFYISFCLLTMSSHCFVCDLYLFFNFLPIFFGHLFFQFLFCLLTCYHTALWFILIFPFFLWFHSLYCLFSFHNNIFGTPLFCFDAPFSLNITNNVGMCFFICFYCTRYILIIFTVTFLLLKDWYLWSSK